MFIMYRLDSGAATKAEFRNRLYSGIESRRNVKE